MWLLAQACRDAGAVDGLELLAYSMITVILENSQRGRTPWRTRRFHTFRLHADGLEHTHAAGGL